MYVTKTHPNGGVFQIELHVQPRFTFTKVSNPAVTTVLDTGPPIQYNDASPYPWVAPPVGNGFNPSGNYPLGLSSNGGCTLALMPNNSIKWEQPPDTSVSGLDSFEYQSGAGGPFLWVKKADDFQCLGGDIVKIRWYGNYENNNPASRIASFHLSLHNCNSTPTPWHLPQDPELVPPSIDAPFAQCNETDTGLTNNIGDKIYSYEYTLSTPYPQIAGNWYWLDVMAKSNDPLNYAIWRWQEAQRAPAPTGPLGHAPAAESSDTTPWSSIIWPNPDPERYSDMAFEIISADATDDNYREYGDAPEGASAYPSMGVTGNFPTCKNVLTAGYIEHNNFGAFFGGPLTAAGFDFETEGNGGICASFSPYDNDECYMDGDAGLLIPDSATIVGGVETLCPQSTNPSLGQTCATAVWGTDIDIEVTNFMPSDTTGYVNVLMDFDQSGNWASSAAGAACTVPEWVLVNHPVPNGYVGPLSALGPLPFTIGPNSGYVWARFSITEVPIGAADWDGTGVFEDGETEDYLLKVDDPPVNLMPKFRQLPQDGPDYFGHDELSTMYLSFDQTGGPTGFEGCYMADDFADNRDTPVIRLKWWGSYMQNVHEENDVTTFLIVFETDVPAGTDLPYSHPGTVILSQEVTLNGSDPTALSPGQFSESAPAISAGGPPCSEGLYEYEAYLEIPFDQEAHTVYWVKIVAIMDIGPTNWLKLKATADQLPDPYAGDLCELLNRPVDEIYELTGGDDNGGFVVPRWGWHNRDYTVTNPYASKQVTPGEFLDGTIPDPASGTDLEIWHFQDDAVSGDITVNMAGEPNQLTYFDENYVFTWPLCTDPPCFGVDGPDGIQDHSKDLAFELLTTECFPDTDPGYADWVAFGKPDCWCNPKQCRGDVDGLEEGSARNGFMAVGPADLGMFAEAWSIKEPTKGPGIKDVLTTAGVLMICADLDHAAEGSARNGFMRVGPADLGILAANWSVKEPTKGPGIPGDCP